MSKNRNKINRELNRKLVNAVKANSLSSVKRLIEEKGADPSFRNSQAANEAYKRDYTDISNYLVEKGAKVNYKFKVKKDEVEGGRGITSPPIRSSKKKTETSLSNINEYDDYGMSYTKNIGKTKWGDIDESDEEKYEDDIPMKSLNDKIIKQEKRLTLKSSPISEKRPMSKKHQLETISGPLKKSRNYNWTLPPKIRESEFTIKDEEKNLGTRKLLSTPVKKSRKYESSKLPTQFESNVGEQYADMLKDADWGESPGKIKRNLGSRFPTKKELNKSLVDAAKHGHIDKIKYLLEQGADIHYNNDQAIKEAYENKEAYTVRFLSDNGADLSGVITTPPRFRISERSPSKKTDNLLYTPEKREYHRKMEELDTIYDDEDIDTNWSKISSKFLAPSSPIISSPKRKSSTYKQRDLFAIKESPTFKHRDELLKRSKKLKTTPPLRKSREYEYSNLQDIEQERDTDLQISDDIDLDRLSDKKFMSSIIKQRIKRGNLPRSFELPIIEESDLEKKKKVKITNELDQFINEDVILKAYQEGKSITNAFTYDIDHRKICNDIKLLENIKINEDFVVKIGKKNYTAKALRLEDFKSYNEDGELIPYTSPVLKKTTVRELAEIVGESLNINPDILVYINGNERNIQVTSIKVPTYMLECIVTDPENILPPYSDSNLELTKGDYLCNGEYTSFLISSFAAHFLRNKQSPHFTDIFNMILCPSIQGFSTLYNFSEVLDDRSLSVMRCSSNRTGLHVSILHSLHLLQKLKINHNNFTLSCIKLEPIHELTEWNGVYLETVNYFEYRFNGTSLYVPFFPFIPRITDFDVSCKYSEPKVLNKDVIFGRLQKRVPNEFDSTYDMLTYFGSLDSVIKKDKSDIRALSELVQQDVTPSDLLNSDFFKQYREKPSDGTILLIASDSV